MSNYSLGLDPKTVKAFKDALRRKGEAVVMEGAKAIEKTAKALEDRVSKKVADETTDTGEYLQSISRETNGLHGDVYSTAAHAPYREFGTGPHRPPFDPIYEWIWHKRHDLGIPDEAVGGAARNLCDKIAAEGTKPGEQWLRSIEETKPDFEKFVREAIKEALENG